MSLKSARVLALVAALFATPAPGGAAKSATPMWR